jgi:hypothetical protein
MTCDRSTPTSRSAEWVPRRRCIACTKYDLIQLWILCITLIGNLSIALLIFLRMPAVDRVLLPGRDGIVVE